MKNLVNKMFNFVNKFLLIFTIICFSISLIGAIFFYTNRSYDYLNPLVLIVGSIVYLLLLIKLYKVIIKLDDKKKKIIVGILLGLQFILLLISAFVISSIPQVDLIHILTEINRLNDVIDILNNQIENLQAKFDKFKEKMYNFCNKICRALAHKIGLHYDKDDDINYYEMESYRMDIL